MEAVTAAIDTVAMIEIEAPCCDAPAHIDPTDTGRVRCDACAVEVDLVDSVGSARPVLAAAA
jgi:hypothetical protein